MVMQHNANHSQRVLRFCEFGHVFHRSQSLAAYIENYSEYDALLLGISGPVHPPNWDQATRICDFFDLKGDVKTLLDRLQLIHLDMKPSEESTELTDYHITLFCDGTRVGTIAKLCTDVQESYDVPHPIFFAEFNWTRLVLLYKKVPERAYHPISLFSSGGARSCSLSRPLPAC